MSLLRNYPPTCTGTNHSGGFRRFPFPVPSAGGRGGVGGGVTSGGSSPVLARIREKGRITPRPET